MRRPTRTRRLSIAAIVSLLLFATVAGAAVRSFWIWDEWGSRNYERWLTLDYGCVVYAHSFNIKGYPPSPKGHISGKVRYPRYEGSVLGFYAETISIDGRTYQLDTYHLRVPLWPLLLLLIVIPVRWLIARPANAPAFRVVAKQP